MKEKLRVLDLFCCAGGSSLGAEAAGCEVVAGVDLWEEALVAFEDNHPNARPILGDVSKIDPGDVLEQIGYVDIILASPPCTGFSSASGGTKWHDGSKDLVFSLLSWLDVFQPKWVVVENVTQIAKWSRINEFFYELVKIGYNGKAFVLQALDYGAYADRERWFLLLSRDGEKKWEPLEGDRKRRKLFDILGDYPSKHYKNGDYAAQTVKKLDFIRNKIGEGVPFLFWHKGDPNDTTFRTLNKPMYTVTSHRWHYLIDGDDNIRKIQPQEYSKAIGFPNPPIAPNGDESVRMMGNAVNPLVMEGILMPLVSYYNGDVDEALLGRQGVLEV